MLTPLTSIYIFKSAFNKITLKLLFISRVSKARQQQIRRVIIRRVKINARKARKYEGAKARRRVRHERHEGT